VTRFRFVEAEAAQFPVSLLCKTVGVTRQGYYAWKRRPPSARELADRKLSERIRAIHLETEEIYGAPRIYSELKLVDGITVGKKRVARLMRQLGIRGADGRRGGFKTTVRDPKRDSAPDLVDRDFARAEPNRLWVCDLKYIQTGQGFLFLAAVQDVFSRRIIGWSMRDDLKAELVLGALGMAVSLRGGDAAGVVAHSDHGSQPRLNRSSQHRFVDLIVNTHSMFRPASASQASCEAGC
jgi:putative transposase